MYKKCAPSPGLSGERGKQPTGCAAGQTVELGFERSAQILARKHPMRYRVLPPPGGDAFSSSGAFSPTWKTNFLLGYL